MLAQHLIVGQKGEALAVRYIQSLPYQVLGTNVRVGRRLEIDILAYDPQDKVIVFVEVKTRSKHDEDFHPHIDVTRRKRRALWRAARQWIAQREQDEGFRIDLVCIENGKIVDHFKELRK